MIYLSKKVSKEYKDGRQLNAVLTLGAVEKPFHLLTPRSNVFKLPICDERENKPDDKLHAAEPLEECGFLWPLSFWRRSSSELDIRLTAKSGLLALNKGLVTALSKKEGEEPR